jgi:hypothetical protein
MRPVVVWDIDRDLRTRVEDPRIARLMYDPDDGSRGGQGGRAHSIDNLFRRRGNENRISRRILTIAAAITTCTLSVAALAQLSHLKSWQHRGSVLKDFVLGWLFLFPSSLRLYKASWLNVQK